MAYELNRLTLIIKWVMDKPTAPGWSDIRNNVGAHTLYYIHEGQGVFLAEREYPVEGGMLAYMHPGKAMSMRSDKHYPLQMTMVLFECGEVGYNGDWQGIASVARLELPFLRRYEPEEAQRLSAAFRGIRSAWVPGVPGGALLSSARLLALLAELHMQAERPSQRARPASAAVEQIKQQLESGYASDLHIETLASEHNISVSYLRRLFQQTMGMSPKQYHSRIRNAHARRYLMFTDLPVQEIARICGYSEEFHFSKAFKQANGVPPTLFRKQHRSSAPGGAN